MQKFVFRFFLKVPQYTYTYILHLGLYILLFSLTLLFHAYIRTYVCTYILYCTYVHTNLPFAVIQVRSNEKGWMGQTDWIDNMQYTMYVCMYVRMYT